MKHFDFDVTRLCTEGVRGLTPYEPGKPIIELQRELGITDVVKLASNENPLGPSPKAVAAVRDAVADLAPYPDGQAYALRQAIARKHDIAPDRITFGDGSDQNIEFMARVFLESGRNAVLSEHAFAVYAMVTQAAGAEVRCVAANPSTHPEMPYGYNLDAMLAAVDRDTRLVFIANPNNPTGTWLDRDRMLAFLGQLPPTTLVVVDEAYFEYVDEPQYPDCAHWLDRFPNLVVSRTFSKAYGLAGLRVGYCLSHPQIAELLNRIRPPFNVNHLAQVGALAALFDTAHIKRTIAMNKAGMRQLEQGFRSLHLTWIPSIGNFTTVDCQQPARPIYEALLRKA